MNRWMSPPVAFAVAVIAMWWIGRSVAIGTYSFAHQAAIGIGLVVLGVAIVGVSLRSFALMGTTPNPMQPQKATELVTSGVYSLSRNPMYVGDAVILAGVAVWIGSVISLVPLAVFVWFIDRFQIAVEEKALAELFGDRYSAYRSKVRRWL
jgi:protein-S-isoprenylcysteine O-methyltransferase Ste14